MLTPLLSLLLAAAAPSPDSVGPRRVLVLPVVPAPAVSRGDSELVRAELKRLLLDVDGVVFLGTREENRAIHRPHVYASMSCPTLECAAELGLMVGVPEVMVGELDLRGGTYTLSLARVSTRSVRVLRQVERRAAGGSALVITRAMAAMVEDLFPSDGGCPQPVVVATAARSPLARGSGEPVLTPAVVTRADPEPRWTLRRPSAPGPDLTWMGPVLVAVGSTVATVAGLGVVPFLLSAVALPVATGAWYWMGGHAAASPHPEVQGTWYVGMLLLPALMALPVGLAAPVVAGAATLVGWVFPAWAWRRNPVSLAKVLPLALAPAVAGSVAAVVPVALAAVAGMAAMVPVLGGRDPSLPEAVGVATVWVAASAGAVALAYLTSVGVVLAPPLVVGAAMANDTTPVHKSDDEDPLPLAQLIRDIDNAGDRRTRR